MDYSWLLGGLTYNPAGAQYAREDQGGEVRADGRFPDPRVQAAIPVGDGSYRVILTDPSSMNASDAWQGIVNIDSSGKIMPAGVWLDRFDRHKVLIATQMAAMAQSLALALSPLALALTPGAAGALSLTHGMGGMAAGCV